MATVLFQTGARGPKGSTIFLGEGLPLGTAGANGDVYIDTDGGGIYAKAAGAWALGGNLPLASAMIPNEPSDEMFKRLVGFGLILDYLPIRNKDDASVIHKAYIVGSGDDLRWVFGPGQAIGDLVP